jgi:hypothetical protein
MSNRPAIPKSIQEELLGIGARVVASRLLWKKPISSRGVQLKITAFPTYFFHDGVLKHDD